MRLADETGHWNDMERLRRLDNPDRERLMPHAPILEALELDQGMHVADIGAGLGYFTFPLAIAVRREGHVLAVDPSPNAREELTRRIQAAKIHNVTVQDGTAARIGGPDHAVDRILWHALFHEVPNLEAACQEMHRVLKHHGLWVVVDWRPGAQELGPRDEERWDRDKAAQLVTTVAPFSVKGVFETGPVTWGIIFERE